MGSIYKRGEVYWIKYYRNGKSYRETSKTNKESEAKRLLKKREGEISEGKIPASISTGSSSMTCVMISWPIIASTARSHWSGPKEA